MTIREIQFVSIAITIGIRISLQIDGVGTAVENSLNHRIQITLGLFFVGIENVVHIQLDDTQGPGQALFGNHLAKLFGIGIFVDN